MKEIINGLLYDTETATLVFKLSGQDYYRTKKGNFFLVSYGIYKDGKIDLVEEKIIKHYLSTNIELYTSLFGIVEEG